jgi:hypothetical protein
LAVVSWFLQGIRQRNRWCWKSHSIVGFLRFCPIFFLFQQIRIGNKRQRHGISIGSTLVWLYWMGSSCQQHV